MTSCRDLLISASGFETTVSVWGPDEAPAVCLLHSLALDRHMFRPLAQQLHGWRVIAYDQRGHGVAAAAAERATLASMAVDVSSILDRLNVRHAHLVGHSMGGLIAAQAAAEAPHRFASLALVATPFKGLPVFADRARQAEQRGMEMLYDETLARWFSQASLEAAGPDVDYAAATLKLMSPQAWAAAWMTMASFNGFDTIGDRLPVTLCISGALDVSAAPQMMEQINRVVTRSTGHISLEGAAHMVALEKPASLARALQAFWSQSSLPV